MVEVATGGDTGEQLPMVLKVPHLNHNPFHSCWIPYSLLGFGDILVPGMVVAYCHSFDLIKGTPCKIYWVVANICELENEAFGFFKKNETLMHWKIIAFFLFLFFLLGVKC